MNFYKSRIWYKTLYRVQMYCVNLHTHGTEGTGSRIVAPPPLLVGLQAPGSMAALNFFPDDLPRDELSLLASFRGVLPAE